MKKPLIFPDDPSKVTKLFISGPMTGYPDDNKAAFAEAADQLRARGYTVHSAHEVEDGDDWGWADYMRANLPALLKAEGLALLSGWEEGKGACVEVEIAKKLEMHIFDVNYWAENR